jgi:hypothetical protein
MTSRLALSIAILLAAVMGCAPSAPALEPIASPIARSAPARPLCEARIRADTQTAVAIPRADAAERAAAEPSADVWAFGTPLSAAEVRELDSSGTSFGSAPAIASWVTAHPEAFAGDWIEPPGSHHLVVAVFDTKYLDIVRCLEPSDFDVAYVTSPWPLTELETVRARVESDRASGRLKEMGIDVLSVEELPVNDVWRVVVGVAKIEPAIEERLRALYGVIVVAREGDVLDTDG